MRKLNDRQEQILLLLKKFDFLSRDQINRCFKLGTIQNTNRILKEMSDYLNSVREGYQTIYYLNREGRKLVECEKIRKKGNHVHAVMRNDMWLYFGRPSDWKNEIKVSDSQTIVIADAMFSHNWRTHFLEVDNTQSMVENRTKIRRYKAMLNSLESGIGHVPTLVWLTTTEHRRKLLTKACEGLPLVKVYTINDIK